MSEEAAPIERSIARQASRWFVLLQGNASERERDACAAWRAGHPDHERAWQLAARFHAQLRDIPAAVGRQALERPRGISRRDTMKLLSLLIVAAPAGVVGYRELPWRAWNADLRTAVGERRELTLPDGTQIHLNTASAVDVAFDDTLRLLRLHAGEMLVSTASDKAQRPLVIQTRDGSARPIGTRFSVRQCDGSTRIAVFEGAVQLLPRNAAGATLLTAGNQASFSSDNVHTPIALNSNTADWTRGVLRADKTRLQDFAAELSRYRPGLLRCDPAVANLQISGAFQLGDTDQALAAIARVLPVDIHYRSRYWVTITPRAS